MAALVPIAHLIGSPFSVFGFALLEILLLPLVLVAKKISSILFIIGAVTYIISSLVTGILTPNELQRSARSFSPLNVMLMPFEFVHSNFPIFLESLLDRFSLATEDCPELLNCQASYFVNEQHPMFTYYLNETLNENSAMFKFLDPTTQIFVKTLFDDKSCSKSLKCKTFDIYRNAMDFVFEKMQKLFGEAVQIQQTSPLPPPITTTTTTPSPFVKWQPVINQLIKYF